MKKTYRIILTLISVAAAVLCVFPVMSARSGGTESCDLIIRGFNLMEFSAWGCVPLLAPLLVQMILFGSQTKAVKETELLILFIGNMICYVHSFNAARAWVSSHCDTPITYYPGMFLIPFVFVAIVGSLLLLESRKENKA